MGEWRKVIPESRDRLQSRVLVWVVGLLLVIPFPIILKLTFLFHNTGILTQKALGISLTFGVLVWALRAATPMAAFLGSVVCFLVTFGTLHMDLSPFQSGLPPMMALFLLTFGSTRTGRRRKLQLGVAEGKKGRNAAQIVANLGASGLVIVAGFYEILDRLCCPNGSGEVGISMYAVPIMIVAALCEATADTMSSEIGQAFGGQPVMLTTMRRVDTGTDGAVTLLGTFAGVAGAAVVAAVGMWAMRMDWRGAAEGFAAGAAGLFFDSVLGATVERKGWLGNDLVNFSSTVFAVVVALGLVIWF